MCHKTLHLNNVSKLPCEIKKNAFLWQRHAILAISINWIQLLKLINKILVIYFLIYLFIHCIELIVVVISMMIGDDIFTHKQTLMFLAERLSALKIVLRSNPQVVQRHHLGDAENIYVVLWQIYSGEQTPKLIINDEVLSMILRKQLRRVLTVHTNYTVRYKQTADTAVIAINLNKRTVSINYLNKR